MAGPAINKMVGNKNILIKNKDAEEVFRKLGIDPKTSHLRDVKKAIFEFYNILNPEVIERKPRKTLYEQKPNNAYGIRITDKEITIFMELFGLVESDPFQDISRRIVKDILTERIYSSRKLINDTLELGDVGMTEDNNYFPEGRRKLIQHLVSERNQALVSTKKEMARKESGLHCCICLFSFEEQYGDIGKDYIEAHHVIPVSELTEDSRTKLEDIVLVCSNCHRMLHGIRPWLGIDELKSILK